MRIAVEDLATPQRIRHAAVEMFGRAGFDTGLRAVADAAGVSLGLIRHHFGSKAALREACDDWVLQRIRVAQEEQRISAEHTGAFLAQIAHVDEYRPLVDYVVRSLREGGSLAATLTTRMIADSREELEAGVAQGIILPSVDPAARARHLVLSALGELVLGYSLESSPEERTRALVASGLPRLELYSQGLLADRSLFEAYLASDSVHPGGAS